MATDTDTVPGVDLTGDDYVIKQSLIRNKYTIYDGDGTPLLKAKQKLLKMKEEFPFTRPDGEEVFTVKAQGIIDIAGDYAVTTADGEPVAVLEKKFTMFKHVWKVRAPGDERLLATIESGSAFVEFLRGVSSLFNLIPHEYTIEGPDGARLGSIEGRLSLRDAYDVHVGDSGDAPKEALVAAAIAIDALEGN